MAVHKKAPMADWPSNRAGIILLWSRLISISTPLGRSYPSLQVQISPPRELTHASDTINTAGLSNPEISSELPYFLADKSAPPTDFGTPPETYVGRGAPTPLNSQVPLWDFGRYNGYPQKDTVDLRDPVTFLTQYYKQPRFNCPAPGKTLYCCYPGEIMCEACEFDFSHLLYLTYLLFSPFPPFSQVLLLISLPLDTKSFPREGVRNGLGMKKIELVFNITHIQIENVIQNA